MEIIVAGLSHRRSPVEVREQVYFPESELGIPLRQLKGRPEIEEAVLLSTCNRVEVYARVRDSQRGVQAIKEFLSHYHEVPLETLEAYMYAFSTREAVRHLFRVASSLDSMVVGESQILRQVKEAYQVARETGATGLYLNNLFERAFQTAKRVRTETRIGENAVSVSYVAVELARKIFNVLREKKVLLIGAGEMAELAAQHLVQLGVHSVLVSNRSFPRAQELAQRFSGRAVLFDDLEGELVNADIVISSTGAPHYVLRRELFQQVIRQRKNRPMFLIDIAIPRDIEPDVNTLDHVYLYDIDDLQQVVSANIKEREREAKRGEELVDQETTGFLLWMETLEVVPTIVSLRERAEVCRQQEIARARAKLGPLTSEEEETLEVLTSAIVNKLLHTPIAQLKRHAGSNDAYEYLRIARNLFDLDD